MRGARRSHARNARPGEHGFTLIETLVSLTLLALIAGVLGTVYTVGLKALAPGGPTDRLGGADAFMVLEQTLGRDGSRAGCIQIKGGTVYGQSNASNTCTTSGATTTGFGKVETFCAPATAVLCFAWPQDTVSSWSCHVAVYIASGTSPKFTIRRTEYSVALGAGSATPAGTVLLTPDAVNFQVPPQSGTLKTVTLSTSPVPGSYTWVRSLPVTITATGVTKGQFAQTLTLHPFATDPDGAASAITNPQGSPC
jgi:prepilin-type N-terminal cleavage/methylation domain-containing protein